MFSANKRDAGNISKKTAGKVLKLRSELVKSARQHGSLEGLGDGGYRPNEVVLEEITK